MSATAEVNVLSAGSKVLWAVETTAGTRPTTGYTQIHGVKGVPEMNQDHATVDVTKIDSENKQYLPDIPDSGGLLQLEVYESEMFHDDWEAMMTAYAALTSGQRLWFEFRYPSGSGMKSYYAPVKPMALGFGGFQTGSAVENKAPYTIIGDCSFETASTT